MTASPRTGFPTFTEHRVQRDRDAHQIGGAIDKVDANGLIRRLRAKDFVLNRGTIMPMSRSIDLADIARWFNAPCLADAERFFHHRMSSLRAFV